MSAALSGPERVSSDVVPVHLTGRRLTLARWVWWALAGPCMVAFLAGLKPSFDLLRQPCIPELCETLHYFALTEELAQPLARWGLTLTHYAMFMTTLYVILAGVWVGLGVFIVWRHPTERIAYLASLALVVMGAFVMPPVAGAFFTVYPVLRPWGVFTLVWGHWVFPALLFLLPDGRFVPHWSRWVYLSMGIALSYVILTPELWPGPRQPQDIIQPIGIMSLLLGIVVGVYSQVYRYRRVATTQARQQIKWIGIGLTGLGCAIFLGGVVQPWPAQINPTLGLDMRLLVTVLLYMGITFFALALTFAVLRYRLWDIDILINRALVYGGLTAIIVGVYALVVGGLGSLFHTQSNALVAFLGAGIIAVLFQPMRNRLQRGVNRMLYGQRDEPYAVLARFGRQLETTPALDTLLPTIVATIQDTLNLPYVTIETPETTTSANPGGPTPHASRPTLHAFPLLYRGETVGQLVVTPREGETELSATDRRLLEDLARQAGVAVHAARVTAELQRARERLVTATEEERRRLRRDLHDGLGPALADLAAQAEAARDLISTRPDISRSLLEDMIVQSQSATVDIRRLVYNLRPPALDDLGLVGAVQAQAQKVQRPDGLAVTVEAPALPALPAAVEVAAFRIIQEALANVVRHAVATRCVITLAVDGDQLNLAISDNGGGLRVDAPIGVGLTSMRERAEELGGVFTFTSNVGRGTLVQARLPLYVEV